MASHAEKVLAVELLGFVAIQTGDAFYTSKAAGTTGQMGGPTLPAPSQYFAGLIVFVMLAGLAATGQKAGRFAAAFGGLVLLYMAVKPNNSGGPSPVVGFLRWLASMYQHPPTTVTASASSGGGAGSSPGGGPSGGGTTAQTGGFTATTIPGTNVANPVAKPSQSQIVAGAKAIQANYAKNGVQITLAEAEQIWLYENAQSGT
ncbi:MAG TPA: hypothetical protein VK386_00315 [Acidimicrobiales bacterium]|nr:hypothetical protein [Acidimicrobiales bacterium]